MTMRTILTPQTDALVQQLGEVDILVGVPSYNNASTIGHVIRAINAGLAKYFPSSRAVLVNSDGGSSDGTPEVVGQSIVDFGALLISEHQSVLHRIITPYHGSHGKGSAFRTIFEIARQLRSKACAVVDSDLRSITPEWIELLIRPVLDEGYDYVAPYYLRHKYDGMMTNSIVYPLTRSLYGQRIRQPVGGDFGFSGRLAEHYVNKDVWDSDVARLGIDIWMTTEAVASGARLCQSFLGPKIHQGHDSTVELSTILTEVVGALLSSMEEHEAVWSKIEGSKPVKIFGFQYDVGVEPIHINTETMVASFRHGLVDLKPIWRQMLATSTFECLSSLAQGPVQQFRIPDDLWAQVIYDVAVTYHQHTMPREHLLKALTPLYLGHTASFVLETQSLSSTDAENRIEMLCQCFENGKRYLLERWQNPANGQSM